MTYEQMIEDVVKVVEACGATIMVLGGAYGDLRRNLSHCILLGLEVLIVADIVRTIIVSPTLTSVAVLGAIVVIRILLSFSLEIEIEGVWPWRRRAAGVAARK